MQHEWGVLSTASAAFSHSGAMGGTKFHGLQFKAEGRETLAMRYTHLHNPATCVRGMGVWL